VYFMPVPVAAVYFRPAFIVVDSEPHGAEVYVDGKRILGNTPAEVEVRRDHADHSVEVRKDGFEPARQGLRYDRQVHLEVSVKLAPTRRPPSR